MARSFENRKQQQRSVTIVGEGLTEQHYFTHIRFLFGYHYTIKPYYFSITSLVEMDKKIAEAISDGGVAIAVFDADVSNRNEEERKRLEIIRKKYGNKKNVVLCDSMTSIEYWFLLHYENTNRYFKDSFATEQELRKHISDYEKKSKFLQNVKWVVDMCADEKLETAIKRAIAFDHNGESYSNVYKAFELLNKLK
ncbi:MAG: RloB domain-containing protein [Bacteroidales bacterium]|nr:RloB domain-containing protein [Bacteroidales bacterium]